MKKVLFTFALLCLLAVQCFAQLFPIEPPTARLNFEYTAFTCSTTNGGASCIPGAGETPVAGVWVTITITPRRGSDFHTHENTGTNRPSDFLSPGSTPARTQTTVNGKAYWSVEGAGWAGIYDIVMTPEDQGSLHFPTKTITIERGVVTKNKAGQDQNLVPFYGGSYVYAATPDIRHRDSAGYTGYSLDGTRACVNSLQKAVQQFNISILNPTHLGVGVDRGSLPMGGKADNEIDAHGNYLFTGISGEWVVRAGAQNKNGIAWDILNPRTITPDNVPFGDAAVFNTLEGLMYKSGLRLAARDGFGNLVGLTRPDRKQYWVNQPMLRCVCQDPMVEP